MPKPQKAKSPQGKTGQQPTSQFLASIILLLLAKKSQEESANSSSGVRIFVLGAILSIGCFLLGWGVEGMNTGDGVAPYLIAVGCAVILVAFLVGCDGSLVKYIHNKCLRYGLYLIVCLIVAIPSYHFSNNKVVNVVNTPVLSFVIEPMSDSSSSNTAHLELGNILIDVAPQGNYMLLVSSVPFLSIGFNKEGYLLLNTTVEDSTNKRAVTIKNNNVLTYQKYTFFPAQPDEHTFILKDSGGDEVLHVNFIDPRTIYLTGIFYLKGYSEPVRITDDNMTYPGGGIPGGLIDLSNSSGNVLDFNKDIVTITVG